MPEAILIVDEAATNRKLTQRVLAGAGYNVRSVESASAALGALAEFRPRLILTDLRMAGMDGLALARSVKENPLTRQTLVIAVTGSDTDEDRRAAMDAGCDDFIVKPIDTRTLPVVIHAHLARQQQDAVALEAATEPAAPELPSWAAELCQEFLRDGLAKSRELVSAGLHAHPDEVRRAAHLWAGLGGTFGYPQITGLARRIQEALHPGGEGGDWLPLLRRLAELFAEVSTAKAGVEGQLPAALIEALAGKRFAIAGFVGQDQARLAGALERAHVQPCEIAAADLLLVTAEALARFHDRPGKPLLVVGTRRSGPQMAMLLDSTAIDFVAAPWTCEEVLARACRLLTRRPDSIEPPAAAPRDRKLRVVIADDDPTILTLVKTTLVNYGIECRAAGEGDTALEMIRTSPPDAAILDVIMPNMDGLEVLAAIRNDRALKNVRVLLLSALQHETDIVRAFGLGADDYVTKPFSPVEVVARLKRLVRTES